MFWDLFVIFIVYQATEGIYKSFKRDFRVSLFVFTWWVVTHDRDSYNSFYGHKIESVTLQRAYMLSCMDLYVYSCTRLLVALIVHFTA